MRRPQKPFTVEVKRAGRTPLSAPPPVKNKPRELTVDDVFKPKSAAADEIFRPRDPEPSKPVGRILDTLTPEPVAELQPELVEILEVEPEAPVELHAKALTTRAPRSRRPSASAAETASLPVKARRGRPPKDRSAPARIVSAPEVISTPVPAAVVVELVERAPVAYLPVLRSRAAPPSDRGIKKAALHPGRLTHSIRAETAESLPRGERWKRRLPKVLW